MHEVSMLREMIAQIDNYVSKNNAIRATRIVMGIGKISGFDPSHLKEMYETFSRGSSCEGAELIIEEEDVLIKCRECNEEIMISPETLRCPVCGSNDVKVNHLHRIKTVYILSCNSCGGRSEEFLTFCPKCNSTNVEIIRGMDIVLKEIEIEK